MKFVIIILLTTLGGWLGWWLGYHIGLFMALILSMIGTGAGIFYGRRLNRMFE